MHVDALYQMAVALAWNVLGIDIVDHVWTGDGTERVTPADEGECVKTYGRRVWCRSVAHE